MSSVLAYNRKVAVSFEVFPPKTVVDREVLAGTVNRLAQFSPSYVSVTYGAGGSTRDRTLTTLKHLRGRVRVPTAGHLTCIGADRRAVDDVARAYQAAGVKKVIALRGDPQPATGRFEPHPEGYASAAELVGGLMKVGAFDVSVAAYPETHPEALSAESDIDNLKRKFDAGANTAITQFFFDASTWFKFVDRVRAAGITQKIVPGIMPITNFAGVQRFAKMCGTSIPGWMEAAFQPGRYDRETQSLIAVSLAAELCLELRDQGVDEFHFYTMNRPDMSAAVCEILGVVPARVLRAAA